MRRSPFVIAATAAGLAGVLSFHTSNPSSSNVANGPTSTTTTPPTGQSGTKGSTPQSTTTTVPTPGGVHKATGKTVQFGYGALAVQVTKSGTKITNVSVVNLQTAESYSQSIAQQVVPLLNHEVLKVQSAQIQGYTGATYTCSAYAQSLQSALTALKNV